MKKQSSNQEFQKLVETELENDTAKILYEKIDSIKSTISMANAERPELWIQRQNLQDLYRQIVLK